MVGARPAGGQVCLLDRSRSVDACGPAARYHRPVIASRLAPATRTLTAPLSWVGARTQALVIYVLRVATMIGYGVGRLTFGQRRMRAVTRRVLVRQVLFTAVEALPFTGLIATLLGLAVIVQAQLNLGAQPGLLGKLLVIVIVRELGPLVAALVIIGRSGTAMVVELGNMRVSGEIETLQGMGVSPFEYLVVPRLGGMAISIFCVSLFVVCVSLASGLLVANLLSPQAPAAIDFAQTMAAQMSGLDFFAFTAKTVAPALAIAGIACYEGLSAGPAITDVPRAATRGTVRAIAVLFGWNATVSAVMYLA